MRMDNVKIVQSISIPIFTNDPPSTDLTSPGLIWYNNTSGSIRYTYNATASSAGTWTVGGTLIAGRYASAGMGTQNEALVAAGDNNSLFPQTGLISAEEYNGTSWSAGGSLIQPRYDVAGAGTQNAGLVFGGGVVFPAPISTNCTEEYNGTTWTAGGAMIVTGGRQRFTGAGIQNEALAMGSGFPNNRCTEEYNGTTWATGGALIIGRSSLSGGGIQNSAVIFGGSSASITQGGTEEYDGTSWSTGGSLIIARSEVMGVASSQNDGLIFGGSGAAPAPATTLRCTEEYNGTSWSTQTAMITARIRGSQGPIGTINSTLAIGGTNTSTTEEYTGGGSSAYCIKSVNYT